MIRLCVAAREPSKRKQLLKRAIKWHASIPRLSTSSIKQPWTWISTLSVEETSSFDRSVDAALKLFENRRYRKSDPQFLPEISKISKRGKCEKSVNLELFVFIIYENLKKNIRSTQRTRKIGKFKTACIHRLTRISKKNLIDVTNYQKTRETMNPKFFYSSPTRI